MKYKKTNTSDTIYDYTIIGGGIVGLSTAYQLIKNYKGQSKPMIAILEKDNVIAKQQSSHNSGVIHSGIYYKPNSLKAKNCIEGYHLLLDYCHKKKIIYDICGKIIVATNKSELPYLQKLHERANKNGLENISMLTSQEINSYEPHINGLEGIHVPQTGIIDYLNVCNSLCEDIKSDDTKVFLGYKVFDFNRINDVIDIATSQGLIKSKIVINCAGLHSDKIARLSLPLIQDVSKKADILSTRIIPFRGEYYKLIPQKQALIKNLVYPVPNPSFPFLGTHFTRKINGEVDAGPNAVPAYSKEGYNKTDIDITDFIDIISYSGFWKLVMKHWSMGMEEIHRSYSKTAFTKSLKKLLPKITEEDLEKASSGVRAQACTINGDLLDDFKIIQTNHFLHVLNAPSPAATSSLAIGKYVAMKSLGLG